MTSIFLFYFHFFGAILHNSAQLWSAEVGTGGTNVAAMRHWAALMEVQYIQWCTHISAQLLAPCAEACATAQNGRAPAKHAVSVAPARSHHVSCIIHVSNADAGSCQLLPLAFFLSNIAKGTEWIQ